MARKKPPKPVRDHLRRDETHLTDEKAQRHFLASIPPEWIANPFQNDYGKDFHVEMTSEGGRVTQAFYVQLKGSAGNCKYINNGGAVSCSLEHKYLTYYLREVKLPVLLVVVAADRFPCKRNVNSRESRRRFFDVTWQIGECSRAVGEKSPPPTNPLCHLSLLEQSFADFLGRFPEASILRTEVPSSGRCNKEVDPFLVGEALATR